MDDSLNLTNGVRISAWRSQLGCAVVRLVLVTAALVTPCAASAKGAVHKPTKAQQRKTLLRALDRDPRVATKPAFLRKAALFGVDVPVTIRLNSPLDQSGTPSVSNDQVKLGLDPPPSDPALPPGVSPGIVTSTIDGGWSGTLRFSADTSGYGRIGVVELGFRQVKMTGTGFDLIDAADPSPCVGGPALLATAPTVSINSGLLSQGYVDLFQGTFEIALHTQFAFASSLRTDCTLGFGTTSVMDGNFRPPIPIRLSGTFRVSPAITPDGQVRLGRLAIRGTQPDSHVEIHTCTDVPPSSPSCPPDSTITGRVVASSFTADLLIGNVAL